MSAGAAFQSEQEDSLRSERLAPVLALLDSLGHGALAELEHALSRRLAPESTAAERRVDELGYLASLLEELKPLRPPRLEAPGRGRRLGRPERPPRLERADYERRQPVDAPAAPTAERLVERYGSWKRACSAAYGLRSDGRTIAAANPWPQPLRDSTNPPRYNQEDVRAAIRRCALSLGRMPSAGDYHAWTRAEKRRARLGGSGERNEGGHPLTPSIQTLYRLYPSADGAANRWRRALADAHLTEAEIADARRRLLKIEEGAAAGAEAGVAAGAGSPVTHRPSPRARELPISEAIQVAINEGISLEWLAGLAAEPGAPPEPGTAFDPSKLIALRKERGVSERGLRDALRLQLGPWRRLLAGQIEPTLGQVAVMVAMLGVESCILLIESGLCE